MNSSLKRIIFIGAPGVGKGTFAKLICKTTGWSTVSMGEKMREEVKAGTDLGKTLAKRLANGELIEDDVVNSLLFKHLYDISSNNSGTEFGQGVILDGYPRTVGQSEAFVQRFGASLAVNIRLDQEVTIKKLLGRRLCKNCNESFNTAHVVEGDYDMPAILPESSCEQGRDHVLMKRDDDTLESIKNRFELYTQKTEPILKHFDDEGMLVNFDVKKGVKDTPQLLALILQRLGVTTNSKLLI